MAGEKLTSTMRGTEYDSHISLMRRKEYPSMFQHAGEALYLDHAGTTPPSATLLSSFHTDMLANLYGNPHSTSPSSMRSTQVIESVRVQALNFVGADPEMFDLVFTSNTTAAIKLVMEAMREQKGGFWFGYHVDSHTSVVGVREAAREHRCFESDSEVDEWSRGSLGGIGLFSYPAQSNLNGRRLPLTWPARIRGSDEERKLYTLLDAAAFAATSPLRLGEMEAAPDFTVLSFTKIFGFPDLGALIVRKDAGHIFRGRRYFGGGTVDMVVCVKEQWHAVKSGSLHEQLEDGTLPFHSILALESAFSSHEQLFGSLSCVAAHTSAIAQELYQRMLMLRHRNGNPVCRIYKDSRSTYGSGSTQGPTLAFNLLDSDGEWISNNDVEKLATVKNIHLRTGGLCNPGGVAKHLGLAPWEMRENFSSGWRCGGGDDIINGRPTGVIRVSFGAMSTSSDAARFADFLNEFFADRSSPVCSSALPSPMLVEDGSPRFYVESLTIYPIKSCAGWNVPSDTNWDIRREGLIWDREWCVVKTGTGAALSQKAHPKMALIRPVLDFRAGLLRVRLVGSEDEVTVPLSKDPRHFATKDYKSCDATVCGENIVAKVYTSPAIAGFFTRAIGVSCTLARFPASTSTATDVRHSKGHLRRSGTEQARRPILLSNESPILTISHSSLNRLNETIKAAGGKAVPLAAFRANIVLAESPFLSPGQEQPWKEDSWEGMRSSSGTEFAFLGGCRRCQMVCVDQESGEKKQEPFVSLAKTRRFPGGRILFGVHTALARDDEGGKIRVGEEMKTW
ncbi:related to Molybdenum cofactor sulfurase [Ramularia collo-cygni]|uniref:Molybdenum cofactor sulfurase n=1 Tax=Ramularia collo-cygni TaxID=112498 RepID=A0A2D3V0W9_9PEZI|nr:related to Molybdenum cofactor sulfurase [Ramularia collo-cygni]CZT18307.1 related to Molybdenum cofactor sulfurase [Ramularia collo-cygni]